MSYEDTLKDLNAKRGSIKGRVTKYKNNLDILDSLESLSTIETNKLALRLSKLEALFGDFDEVQNQIEIINSDRIDAELTIRDLIEQDFYHCIAFSKAILDKNNNSSTNAPEPIAHSSAHHSCCHHDSSHDNPLGFRLPEIKIPHFDGSSYKWLEFKEIFTSLVHVNSKIKNIHKLHYLCSYLQGDAARVLSNLEITDSNYSVAWEILCQRFDNKRQLISNHLKSLLNFESLQCTERSIRFVIDHVTKNLRALNNLGLPTEKWDVLIIHLVSAKLDNATHFKWEEYRNNLAEIPTLENFFSFLKSRADVLETSQQRSRQEKTETHRQNSNNNYKTNKVQTKALVAIAANENDNSAQPKGKAAYLCVLCKSSHPLFRCPTFKGKSVEERINISNSHGLCSNCLRDGHKSNRCNLPGTCRVCRKRHNSLLHQAQETKMEPTVETNTNESISMSTMTSTTQDVLLSTAEIQVTNPTTNDTVTVRALLDSGSQSTFITETVKQRLNLAHLPTSTQVIGIGNTPLGIPTQRCTIQIHSRDRAFNVRMSCLVLPSISGKIPKVPLNTEHLQLSKFSLADPKFHEPAPIDMLIGADLFWDLIGSEQRSLGPKNPILQSSKLGWLIAGPIYNPNLRKKGSLKTICNFLLKQEPKPNLQDLDVELKKFWELESLPQVKALTKEEQLCEQHFQANTTRTTEGRFCVSLPLKEDPSLLGSTYGLAKKRLQSLEARFRRQPDIKISYTDFLHEYEELGHLSKVTVNSSNPICKYYLPHHPVIKETSESTKVRVVFEACAKQNPTGLSVNDIQMVGPTIQDPLFNILVRFRQHRYVVTADIEKMFRAIEVVESDRHLQRILWRDTEGDPIQTLQLNTVTYGFASASFLATRCIFQVGENAADSTIKNIIQRDFYCDDLLTGGDTEAELLHIQRSVSSELAKYGFHLRKYRTNLHTPMFEDSNEGDKDKLLFSNATSTLGVGWTPSSDEFNFNLQHTLPEVVTKRSILSATFKIFDPLGLLSLCTIKPKIMLQELWNRKLDWEDPVPQDIHNAWHRFTSQLSNISCLKIPRFVLTADLVSVELHCFNDASMRAYGSCIYARALDVKGNVKVSLICAKSRVAPVKATTIPRLELCAALLGAQLAQTVTQALRCSISRHVFWTDSTVVLGWLRSPNKAKTFVANRVSAINDLTDITCWRHVPTELNPADLVSRGVDPDHIQTILWWNGPGFLSQAEPRWPTTLSPVDELPEMKAHPAFVGEAEPTPSHDSSVIKIENYSKLAFLQRVLAQVLRFIHNLKHPTDKLLGPLTAIERARAMDYLIKTSQAQSFSKELILLRNDKPLKALASLNPFIDAEGVCRVGGRIGPSAYPFDKKHPILLKADNHLTKLIFQFEHQRLFHSGPQHVLASIRERYWPIGGRNLARRVCRECVICRRFRGKTMTQLMGNLPSDRVEPDFPFHTVGTDFAGPFLITDRKGRGCKITKCYLCIFVCFRYKCVHLEVVSDLSKEAFLLTLKRFIARRGQPKVIYCDNGRNFVAAAKDIKDFLKNNKNSVVDFASQRGIEFCFSPAYAPHFGGLWEAGVKSAKSLMRRVLKNTHLTFEELTSLFSQIEAILNSRPLSPLSSSPHDYTPLTPGHFIIGRPLTSLPAPCLPDGPANSSDRYRRIEQFRQHFWRRWSRECIAEMQQRTKWRTQTTPLKPNDLVLIKEDSTPPLCWRLGRVDKVHPGSDNLPRVADVTTAQGVIRRALNRLCLLPNEG